MIGGTTYKPALRLLLYMPQAHWRVPYAYQRRHTLALPPYSTVIGLLCNLLGIRNLHGEGAPCQCPVCSKIWAQNPQVNGSEPSPATNQSRGPDPQNDISSLLYHELVHQLELSIVGTFATKTTEYTWFRNLNAEKHKDRFGSETNRIIDFTAEHPGYQQPVSIDILNDVHLIIHIGSQHNCGRFLYLIKYAIENDGRLAGVWEKLKNIPERGNSSTNASTEECPPACGACAICHLFKGTGQNQSKLKEQLERQQRLYPLHLGRAEDWVVIEEEQVPTVNLRPWEDIHPISTNRFHWVPREVSDAYGIGGLRYRIPTFYALADGRRLFHYREVFLSDGNIEISPSAAFSPPSSPLIFLDPDLSENFTPFPVFLTKMTG